MIYRICTEDVNEKATSALVAENFPCFTVFKGHGYWQGKRERSLCYEIWLDEDLPSEIDPPTARSTNWERIQNVGFLVACLNHQEAVLVQRISSEGRLLYNYHLNQEVENATV